MKKFITLVLILFVLILFCSSLIAQPHPRFLRGEEMGGFSFFGMIRILKTNKKELQITDSQIKKIEGKIFSFEERVVQMSYKAQLQRLELKKLVIDKKNRDYGKIKSVLSKISDSRQLIMIERMRMMDAIRNILTEEQIEALKAKRKNRFGFFGRGDRMFPPLMNRRNSGKRMGNFRWNLEPNGNEK